jgi:hypothetical protein
MVAAVVVLKADLTITLWVMRVCAGRGICCSLCLQSGRSGHYCTVRRSQLGRRLQQSTQPRSDHLITGVRPFVDKGDSTPTKGIAKWEVSPIYEYICRCTSCLCYKHRSEPRSRVDGMEPQPRFPRVGCRTGATSRDGLGGWEWRHILDMIFLQTQILNSVSYCILRMYIAVAHAQANHN